MKKFLCLLAGVAVLAVAAGPAVGQSSDKANPAGVTRKSKPLVPHKFPWNLRTYGKVKKPKKTCPPGQQNNNPYCQDEIPDSDACKGKVRVTYTLGKKVVAKKTTKVKPDCSYSAKSKIKNKSLAGQRLRVQARFLGNAVMSPRSSARRRILLARHSTGL